MTRVNGLSCFARRAGLEAVAAFFLLFFTCGFLAEEVTGQVGEGICLAWIV